jgi:hypothetical protein
MKYRIWTNGKQYRVEKLTKTFWRERWVGLDTTGVWDYWYANERGKWKDFTSVKGVEDFLKTLDWRLLGDK